MATESITCIGIGLFFASLCLAIVPLVHCRAVRLTTRRLEAYLQQSMAKIEAGRKIRAEPTASSTKMTEDAKLLLLAPNFGQPLLRDTWIRGEPMSDVSLIPTAPDDTWTRDVGESEAVAESNPRPQYLDFFQEQMGPTNLGAMRQTHVPRLRRHTGEPRQASERASV